jgi:uridine kinase
MTEYIWSIYLNEVVDGQRCIEGLETYFESCQRGQKLESPELETFFIMFAIDEPHGVLREKEIANKGQIAVGTVKNHRTAIYSKFGLTQKDENYTAIDPHRKKGGDLWSKLYAGYLKLKKGTESISIETKDVEIEQLPSISSHVDLDKDTIGIASRGYFLESEASKLQDLIRLRQTDRDGNLWRRELDTGGINQLLNTTIDENNLPNRVDLDRSIVIGISGGSCSGKTWLSHQFQKLCPVSVCVFDLDGYYKNKNDVMTLEHTHDNPDSINFDDALFDLGQLKAGQAVKIPKYNFKSQQQEGFRLCTPTSIILVEGVFSFSKPRLLQEFDFKVWVEADDVTRYQRRLNRDVTERGRDPLEVEQRYEQNVRPGYEKFIYPNRRVADITIHNDINSDSIPEGLYALIAYCLVDKSIFNKKA